MAPKAEMPPQPVRADATMEGRPHPEDVELVRRILAGDSEAWDAFILRYAGLIYSVVRRYLHSRDQDDVQTVFVDVLVSLKRSKFSSYQGRAALSTWLTLVTRSQVIDHLRKQFGRNPKLKAMRSLTVTEQELFRLFYIEGHTPNEVVTALTSDSDPWTLDRFIAALRRIEKLLGDRWLRRLSYDLHAHSTGAASGRLLEYLDHVRDEFQTHAGGFSPEYHLMEREARRTTDQMREIIAGLPPRDRIVLEMKFERGWTARRIASELGIESPRGVYSLIERVVSTLRRRLFARGEREP